MAYRFYRTSSDQMIARREERRGGPGRGEVLWPDGQWVVYPNQDFFTDAVEISEDEARALLRNGDQADMTAAAVYLDAVPDDTGEGDASGSDASGGEGDSAAPGKRP